MNKSGFFLNTWKSSKWNELHSFPSRKRSELLFMSKQLLLFRKHVFFFLLKKLRLLFFFFNFVFFFALVFPPKFSCFCLISADIRVYPSKDFKGKRRLLSSIVFPIFFSNRRNQFSLRKKSVHSCLLPAILCAILNMDGKQKCNHWLLLKAPVPWSAAILKIFLSLQIFL